MKMTTVNKVQFGSLNGKQFYHSWLPITKETMK